jgi:microcystin-dependent protein
VSRVIYPRLFALLGITYGAGDGSTTFNLPDRRGLVGVGQKVGDADFSSISAVGGAKTHILETGELPAHDHAIDHNHAAGTTSSDAHTHTITHQKDDWFQIVSGGEGGGTSLDDDSTSSTGTKTLTTSSDTHSHTLDLAEHVGDSAETGSGTAHNNLQPFGVELVCIRA